MLARSADIGPPPGGPEGRLAELRTALLATEIPEPQPPFSVRARAACWRAWRWTAPRARHLAGRAWAGSVWVAGWLAPRGSRVAILILAGIRRGLTTLARASGRVALASLRRAPAVLAGAGRRVARACWWLLRALLATLLWTLRALGRAMGVVLRPITAAPRGARALAAHRPSRPSPSTGRPAGGPQPSALVDPKLRQAQNMLEAATVQHGVDHLDTAAAMHLLAALRHDRGEHELASRLYADALGIRERVLGDQHPSLAQTLEDLAELRADMGQGEAAAEIRRRATALRAVPDTPPPDPVA